MGYRHAASAGLEHDDDDSSRIAGERAAEAVQTFHGTLHAALRSGGANGEIAGLADREPSNLPKWVNANHPELQSEWFRLAEEMKVVGWEWDRVERIRVRTETLQSRLEALATDRPTDDRELLDANCDKLSKLAAVLKEFCDRLAEDKTKPATK